MPQKAMLRSNIKHFKFRLTSLDLSQAQVPLYYAGVLQSTLAGASEAPATSSTPAPKPRVLKTEARLVIVDTTALDKKGMPIKGLSTTDFLLKEDNIPQTILR
jgi:hypothetical protein